MPRVLNVVYTGTDPLPDTFKDNAQALADGRFGPDGIFEASKIQAKCASKYEAKPVQRGLSHESPATKISSLSRPASAPNASESELLTSLYGKCRSHFGSPCLLHGRIRGRGRGHRQIRQAALPGVSAERAVYAVWVLLTLASGVLVTLLSRGDYRLAYVAGHSNQAMSAFTNSQPGGAARKARCCSGVGCSSTYSAIVVFTNRRKFRDMMPIVIAIMMTTVAFFVGMITFVASPFQVLMAGKGIIDVGDGNGLSPLLQWWTMAIHPPFLYLGYVGFTVPFAFAMASLLTKQPGEAWIHTTRRWAIVTWLFQSTGILLGMGWAYTVLGWGGYWGWDPVENASLMPWITATAFLHSVMMQEKKGMMKVWNMVLVSATFLLSILGTTLTRTGLVSSVHAFAQSPVKPYFTTFLITAIVLTVFAIVPNLPYLRSEVKLESVVSRESSFLFNNLILLASCFAVLWGTLFPVIMEAVTGEKETIDAPYYNRVNVPIALFLIFLTGVGPLIAWRKSSVNSLKKAFLIPAFIGVLTGVALLRRRHSRDRRSHLVRLVRVRSRHHPGRILEGIARHPGERESGASPEPSLNSPGATRAATVDISSTWASSSCSSASRAGLQSARDPQSRPWPNPPLRPLRSEAADRER